MTLAELTTLISGGGHAGVEGQADESEMRERVPLHQLAPLAVHAIKFGGGYIRATRDALALLR